MKKVIAIVGFFVFVGAGMYAINKAPDSSLALAATLIGFVIMIVGLVKS